MLSILLLNVFVNKRCASALEFRSEFPLQSYEHRLNGLSVPVCDPWLRVHAGYESDGDVSI